MSDKDKSRSRIVPDTSVIIDGVLSSLIESGELKDFEIILPMAVLDELQSQASKNKEHGFRGLAELKKIRSLSSSRNIDISYRGDKPSLDDIRLARSGRIDGMIRDFAKSVDGILYTADYVQALVSEALGVDVKYIAAKIETENLEFERFFDEKTLSIHLKEGTRPRAKRGKPGAFRLVNVDNKPLLRDDIEGIIKEISEATRVSEQSRTEIRAEGALVIQMGTYRIAITRPPFSDALEVTVVRPIVKLQLKDYKLSEKLMEKMMKSAEGILIAGSPGSGKTTLASSLADFYNEQEKVVKTFESPKELQVVPEVTQYGPLEGDFEKTAEILLLVRPDYSVFDEIRKSKDFQIFADMRLAGVGMIGVVHASNSVNAVQRFVGRVELGMIPNIIDTVIFVQGGSIHKVYELSLSVKVPAGMTEADLARPVVDVKDFNTGTLEYEIYTFGKENVIVPVSSIAKKSAGIGRLAGERIKEMVSRFDPMAEVEVISDNKVIIRVDRDVMPRIIGKRGAVISDLEDTLGLSIDVESKLVSLGREIMFDLKETGNSIDLIFKKHVIGNLVNIYVENNFLFSATAGRKGKIRTSKSSDLGKSLVNAILANRDIKAVLQD